MAYSTLVIVWRNDAIHKDFAMLSKTAYEYSKRSALFKHSTCICMLWRKWVKQLVKFRQIATLESLRKLPIPAICEAHDTSMLNLSLPLREASSSWGRIITLSRSLQFPWAFNNHPRTISGHLGCKLPRRFSLLSQKSCVQREKPNFYSLAKVVAV